jgi:hypothetical protein
VKSIFKKIKFLESHMIFPIWILIPFYLVLLASQKWSEDLNKGEFYQNNSPNTDVFSKSPIDSSNIEILISWNTSDNFDLIVETPSGSLIWRKNKEGEAISMTQHSNENVYTPQGFIDSIMTVERILVPAFEKIVLRPSSNFERGEYSVFVLFDDRRFCEKDSTTNQFLPTAVEVSLNIYGDIYKKQLLFVDMLNNRCKLGEDSNYVYTRKSLYPAVRSDIAKLAYRFIL